MENENSSQPTAFSQYPPTDNFDNQPQEQPPLKHSGLGIASFVISLVSLLLIVIGIIMATVFVAQISADEDFIASLEEMSNSFLNDPESYNSDFNVSDELASSFVVIIIAVIMMFGSVAISFIGLILGIIGVASRQRRKTFGIIGLILNGIIVLGAFGLFFMGIIANLSI